MTKMTMGTILATVATVLINAASLTPRKTRKWTPHRREVAETSAVGVVPSPKMGKNSPSVDLMRMRQAASAKQQPIQ
jgi:hypothetical protein